MVLPNTYKKINYTGKFLRENYKNVRKSYQININF